MRGAKLAKARQIQSRLERLLEAGIRLYREKALDRVLQEVADSAREVTEAKYAALGVLNAEGTGLSQFVTSGISQEMHARIGTLPSGKGILGLLIRDPKPLRLGNLTTHPASYGFPPHHPPMRSFLGVPIVGRSGPIGNLYLTEKQDAKEFDQEDESIAMMLAAQAAAAIENARLHQRTTQLVRDLQELQQSRDRFYAMINHELRNALTAVYGWAELLVRRSGPDAPQAAREVFESAERTLTLINDLLDLSRLDASKLSPVIRDAEAGALVQDAVQAIRPAAEARGVRLDLDGMAGEIPCRTDPQRVRQILINLLSNAVRHSPDEGAVSVRTQANDQQVRFHVVDQGEGLSPEQQAVIFDAFSRAGRQDSRGTGLGLTLSRQLARLLGGDLMVESRPGAGAQFTLAISRYLPESMKSAS